MNESDFGPCAEPIAGEGLDYDPDTDVLFFLHLPKAAGTSFTRALREHFAEEEAFEIGRGHTLNDLRRLQTMPIEQRERLRLVTGHMPFGTHKHIPRRPRYVTIVRDPVDRIVSHYYYARRTKSHYLHRRILDEQMTIAQYVESGISLELDNGQTRLLFGVHHLYEFGQCPPAMGAVAAFNLRRFFTHVGTVEQLSPFLADVAEFYGLDLAERRENVSRERLPLEEVSQEDRATIERYNTQDRELYERVRAWWSRREAAEH